VASKAVDNGVIVDAGSAITVDVSKMVFFKVALYIQV
jgi:pantothenate kinase type III